MSGWWDINWSSIGGWLSVNRLWDYRLGVNWLLDLGIYGLLDNWSIRLSHNFNRLLNIFNSALHNWLLDDLLDNLLLDNLLLDWLVDDLSLNSLVLGSLLNSLLLDVIDNSLFLLNILSHSAFLGNIFNDWSFLGDVFNIFFLDNIGNIFSLIFYSIIVSDYLVYWDHFLTLDSLVFNNDSFTGNLFLSGYCFVFSDGFFIGNVFNSTCRLRSWLNNLLNHGLLYNLLDHGLLNNLLNGLLNNLNLLNWLGHILHWLLNNFLDNWLLDIRYSLNWGLGYITGCKWLGVSWLGICCWLNISHWTWLDLRQGCRLNGKSWSWP
jgi:hypothetical protein